MKIWQYRDCDETPKEIIVRRRLCLFCKSEMHRIFSETSPFLDRIRVIDTCEICGWWTTWKSSSNIIYVDDRKTFNLEGTSAILKRLNLKDVTVYNEEIERYLAAKYDSRYDISPRILEEVVSSIYKNIGYSTILTAFHNDGGIDVILNDGSDKETGVQVKRYKNSIKVSQIREFAGALMENGYTNGRFVTTSQFQSGAKKTTEIIGKRGIGIKLVDSKRLYDALKISLKNRDKNSEDFINTINGLDLPKIYENESAS